MMNELQKARLEDASTVILVREDRHGLEVYMTRRRYSLRFLGGFQVFPGGKVDDGDIHDSMIERCRGLTPGEAMERMDHGGEPRRAMGFFVAGMRELFEEAGILICEDEPGNFMESLDGLSDCLSKGRLDLLADRARFKDLLSETGLFLSFKDYLWFAHWITPPPSPRRFYTHFFVARKPRRQEPNPSGGEIAEAGWIKPARALELWRNGQWQMIPPTVSSLATLSRYQNWESLYRDFSRAPSIHPRTVWKGGED